MVYQGEGPTSPLLSSRVVPAQHSTQRQRASPAAGYGWKSNASRQDPRQRSLPGMEAWSLQSTHMVSEVFITKPRKGCHSSILQSRKMVPQKGEQIPNKLRNGAAGRSFSRLHLDPKELLPPLHMSHTATPSGDPMAACLSLRSESQGVPVPHSQLMWFCI